MPDNSSPASPFKNALRQLERATRISPFDPKLLTRLSAPEREVTVNIPLTMDDGSTKMVEGYRVQHSSLRGPYKGGVRYHPATDTEEVRALAFWMTIKTAVANLPLGGGKGGITIDPKLLSPGELERLSRGWVRGLYPVIGPSKDIPAPDVGTTPQIMAWMLNEYEQCTGDTTHATFTGKPLEHHGSEGRTAATGMGGWHVFAALKDKLKIAPGASVAVQGMGNVGGYAAKIFSEHGYRVVAISDSKGGIYRQGGIDLQALDQFKQQPRDITNEELLQLPVDILIPAALENQITERNASKIEARLILELANGPITPEADDILSERGTTVVPDILANAGGVVVSSFEWEQNLKGEKWSAEVVGKKLEELLTAETLHIHSKAEELHTDLRRAAFVVALERLERAMRESNPQ